MDFERLLRNYQQDATPLLQQLLPGELQALSPAEAGQLLRLVATTTEDGARTWSREEVRIIGIERRPLIFSDWQLFQVYLMEDGRQGAIDVIASEQQARTLDGQSTTIYALIKEGVIQLDGSQRGD